ncbi:MAG TPA: trimeric intracellular cation channel family protein [Candidatus Acidoferrum sp.]|nr:trimeric intracellular cation channel family protein [Candidatus Acidoferrum sp.]
MSPSDVLSYISPFFVQILDLFGTMAFALTGAFKAVEHKSDIVGVIVLSTITGVAGGVLRDIILGRFPPTAIINPSYIIVTVSTAIIIFFLYPSLKQHWNIFLRFDAIGLGVFTIIGASIAYNLYGLNFLVIGIAGILTAVGGGILRDVFVNEMPLVFFKELYASASFVGVVIFFVLLVIGINVNLATLPSILVVILVRLVAMRFNWNLPRART